MLKKNVGKKILKINFGNKNLKKNWKKKFETNIDNKNL